MSQIEQDFSSDPEFLLQDRNYEMKFTKITVFELARTVLIYRTMFLSVNDERLINDTSSEETMLDPLVDRMVATNSLTKVCDSTRTSRGEEIVGMPSPLFFRKPSQIIFICTHGITSMRKIVRSGHDNVTWRGHGFLLFNLGPIGSTVRCEYLKEIVVCKFSSRQNRSWRLIRTFV